MRLWFYLPEYKLKFGSKALITILTAIILIFTPSIGYGLDNVFAAIAFAGLIYIVLTKDSR